MIFRLFIAFIPLFAGFWMATQKLAELVEYTFLLGEPFMVSKGIPYYLPHNYFIWFINFNEYIPQLFAKTYPYIFVSFVVSFLLLFLLLLNMHTISEVQIYRLFLYPTNKPLFF